MLQKLAEEEKLVFVDAAILVGHGFVSKHSHYKILGTGVLKTKIDVCAHAFSASARTAIEKLGGQATIIDVHA
jgi:large subunit ribosomal protein L15